jgi:two-component system, NarL family, sensor histidine kinase UhpB
MNRLLLWARQRITTRLILIAVAPAAVMFLAVMLTFYKMTLDDAQREVVMHGRIMASAVAQSSRYNVVSGTLPYLQTTLEQLVKEDASISCATVLSTSREPLAKACRGNTHSELDLRQVETPIQIETLPDLDVLNGPVSPAMAGSAASGLSANGHGQLRTIGYVKISMSVAPTLQARGRSMLIATALVLAAAVASGIVGLVLSRRLVKTFDDMMSNLRAIRKGDFRIRFSNEEQGELGELQKAIRQMAASLDSARHDLERQVEQRTQELQDTMERLRRSDAEKRRLIQHGNALLEADRKRVAVDIHDHLGASLISVRLEASALQAKALSIGDAESATAAGRICKTAESLYGTTRSIIKSLRPEVIDTLGLSGAIEEMVRHLDKLYPECQFHFHAGPAIPDVRDETAIMAYRIVQEALTNIVKHAGANQAWVNLDMAQGQSELHMVIQDNGKGFVSGKVLGPGGLGLIGMRERVESVGGKIHIQSDPGKGTVITVSIRLDRPET